MLVDGTEAPVRLEPFPKAVANGLRRDLKRYDVAFHVVGPIILAHDRSILRQRISMICNRANY